MIDYFAGEYRFLSNFYSHAIQYEGLTYPAVEHAFQAAKTTDVFIRHSMAMINSCAEVKRVGQTIALRSNWESLRDDVMLDLIDKKFDSPNLKKRLLATYDQELVEGNLWHDNYWGSCRCEKCGDKGKNQLGKILMVVREAIYNERH